MACIGFTGGSTPDLCFGIKETLHLRCLLVVAFQITGSLPPSPERGAVRPQILWIGTSWSGQTPIRLSGDFWCKDRFEKQDVWIAGKTSSLGFVSSVYRSCRVVVRQLQPTPNSNEVDLGSS